jgi:hypothetical protein
VGDAGVELLRYRRGHGGVRAGFAPAGTIATTTETQVALNRIFHGPTHPSRLTLPVIARPR